MKAQARALGVLADGVAVAQAGLARQLIAACIEILDLTEATLSLEFTRHSSDEMYHPTLGGFSPDWHEGEV